jgi:hypothetical protein
VWSFVRRADVYRLTPAIDIGLLLRLRLSTGLPFLINCLDMTADRTAK